MSGPGHDSARAIQMMDRLVLALVLAILAELRDAAVAFQGPTETPAEAGQRGQRLREAAELASRAIEATDKLHGGPRP